MDLKLLKTKKKNQTSGYAHHGEPERQKHWYMIASSFIVVVLVLLVVGGILFNRIRSDEYFKIADNEQIPVAEIDQRQIDEITEIFSTRAQRRANVFNNIAP